MPTHRIPVEDMYATIVIYDLVLLVVHAGSLRDAEHPDAVMVRTNRLAFVERRDGLAKIILPATSKIIAIAMPEIVVILNTVRPCLLFVVCGYRLIPIFEGNEVTVGPRHVDPGVAAI